MQNAQGREPGGKSMSGFKGSRGLTWVPVLIPGILPFLWEIELQPFLCRLTYVPTHDPQIIGMGETSGEVLALCSKMRRQ